MLPIFFPFLILSLNLVLSVRIGDPLLAYVSTTKNLDVGNFFDGIFLCTESQVAFKDKSIIRVEFPSGLTSDWLQAEFSSDWIIYLEAHEGRITGIDIAPIQQTHVNERLLVQFKWKKCSFDSDELLALQVLFAFGSITSIVVVIAVILDSRFKRDKYS